MEENKANTSGQNMNAESALNYLEEKRKELTQLKSAITGTVEFMDTPDATLLLSAIGKAIEHRDNARNTLYRDPEFKNKAKEFRVKLANNPAELQRQIRGLEKSDRQFAAALRELKTATDNYNMGETEFHTSLSAMQSRIKNDVLPTKEKDFKQALKEYSPLLSVPLERLKNAYWEAVNQMKPFFQPNDEKTPLGMKLLANSTRLRGFPEQKECRVAFINSLQKVKKEITAQNPQTKREIEVLKTTEEVLQSLQTAQKVYTDNCAVFGKNGDTRVESILSYTAETKNPFLLQTTPTKNAPPKEHTENAYVMRAKQYLQRREVLKKNVPLTQKVSPVL